MQNYFLIRYFSECLGLPYDIVKSLQIFLIAISCQKVLDIEKFRNFSRKVAELWVKRFDWYPMPPGIHKMLIHGKFVFIMNHSLFFLSLIFFIFVFQHYSIHRIT